ncbi:MAG: DUF1153 domain-containing protein [Paracoccus sp. (in: a-proteobacteria)]|nr:DUF1153 domain-containing protein [Paracoccus sp. (in: a-proteobacteria)]
MFLRRSTGPRIVTLDDGRVISAADLPPARTRWVASRKAMVVAGVRHGLITRDAALERYQLSDEEFDGWCRTVDRHGPRGLRVTAIPQIRQP